MPDGLLHIASEVSPGKDCSDKHVHSVNLRGMSSLGTLILTIVYSATTTGLYMSLASLTVSSVALSLVGVRLRTVFRSG